MASQRPQPPEVASEKPQQNGDRYGDRHRRREVEWILVGGRPGSVVEDLLEVD